MTFNEVAQQHFCAAAQHRADSKSGHGGDKNHGDTGEHTGERQGQDHPPGHLNGVGAQIPGCLNEIAVQLYDYGINGQNHEREVVIYHAQHNSPLCIDHAKEADVRTEDAVIKCNNADFAE